MDIQSIPNSIMLYSFRPDYKMQRSNIDDLKLSGLPIDKSSSLYTLPFVVIDRLVHFFETKDQLQLRTTSRRMLCVLRSSQFAEAKLTVTFFNNFSLYLLETNDFSHSEVSNLEAFKNHKKNDIATLQGRRGDVQSAFKLIESISSKEVSTVAFHMIALTQSRRKDFAGARQTVEKITCEGNQESALETIQFDEAHPEQLDPLFKGDTWIPSYPSCAKLAGEGKFLDCLIKIVKLGETDQFIALQQAANAISAQFLMDEA